MNLSPLPKQKFFNSNGAPLVGGLLFTYVAGTTTKLGTYKNQAGTVNTNPIVLDYRGECDIWLDPALTYKFTLAPPGDTDPPTRPIWTVDNITALGTQQDIGKILYPRTLPEIAAGVTPTNYAYPEGNGLRYGVVADGTTSGGTDNRGPIQAAYDVFINGGAPPLIRGNCRILRAGANTYSLLFNSHVAFDGDGALTLIADGVNEYNLIKISGGTNVDIDLRGINLNGNFTPSAANSNSIGVWIDSSINSINVCNVNPKNYKGDGIYINASVTGPGGTIRDCISDAGGRSGFTIVKGKNIRFVGCEAHNPKLFGFNANATDNATDFLNLTFIDCVVNGGGDDTNFATDRCGFFLCGKTGAALTVQRNVTAQNCKVFNFGAAYGGASFAFGFETREMTDCMVTNATAIGCKSAGLYSYLTTNGGYVSSVSNNNDKGIWMNACTDYTDAANTCLNNTTYNYDYHGPDGATSYVRADGLNMLIARANVSINAGVPTFNEGFNVSSLTDLGVGDTRLNLTRSAGTANYCAQPAFRSHPGTSGLIESASQAVGSFRVLTFNAGAAADIAFNVDVFGVGPLTNLPP